METECGPSNSSGIIMKLTKDDVEISIRQQSLIEIKRWIETEAEFYGRSDEAFLLLFLQSCEFDMRLSKTTLVHYYECRRDVPQWLANRNLNDEVSLSILKLMPTVALMEGDVHQPTVIFTIKSRFSNKLNNMDDYMRLAMITLEKVVRRRNSQRNGTVWIFDFENYKRWIVWEFLKPIHGKTFIDCCFHAFPVKLKAIIVINAPFIMATFAKVMSPLLPESIKGRLHVYGSDWSSKISGHLPLDLLPDEYGGQAGPMESHDVAFVEELMAFNDYIVDDNKYGFQ